jgi:hypothetical protein
LLELQQKPIDEDLFMSMMKNCLTAIVTVLEKQYRRYFDLDVTNELRKETESARCHNIDAEQVMGMFSAAKANAPNATLCYISSRLRAQKNRVADYLDSLEPAKREKLMKLAITLERKVRQRKRKKCIEIRQEISRRVAAKKQQQVTYQRNKYRLYCFSRTVTMAVRQFFIIDMKRSSSIGFCCNFISRLSRVNSSPKKSVFIVRVSWGLEQHALALARTCFTTLIPST